VGQIHKRGPRADDWETPRITEGAFDQATNRKSGFPFPLLLGMESLKMLGGKVIA